MGQLEHLICTLLLIPQLVTSLKCYKCDTAARAERDCEALVCYGDCGYIETRNSSVFPVEYQVERRCVPSAWTDVQVCATSRQECVQSTECACSIQRCNTDVCNGFSEYIVSLTEQQQMVKSSNQPQGVVNAQDSTPVSGRNRGQVLKPLYESVVLTILIFLVLR